jgi:hypothetical protein
MAGLGTAIPLCLPVFVGRARFPCELPSPTLPPSIDRRKPARNSTRSVARLVIRCNTAIPVERLENDGRNDPGEWSNGRGLEARGRICPRNGRPDWLEDIPPPSLASSARPFLSVEQGGAASPPLEPPPSRRNESVVRAARRLWQASGNPRYDKRAFPPPVYPIVPRVYSRSPVL